MRSAALIAMLAGIIATGIFFAGGLDDALARSVLSLQRDYQNALGRVLRALRAGEAGAVAGFLGICLAYGFFHALGPGHGKAVIAAYGFGSGSTLRRIVGIAALSSLGQASVAVLLIYAGVWLYDGARDRVEALAARIDPFGMVMIALLGLLLLWRGLKRLRALATASQRADDHAHDADCGCGIAHVPAAASVANARSWREITALVLGIALRPCTGALFLLILTWRLGIDGLGILGAFVMGFGTFMVTGMAAVLAVAFRNAILVSLPDLSRISWLAASVEVLVGAAIFVLGGSVALRLL